MLAYFLDQTILQLLAFRTGLGKPGSNHNDGPHSFGRALVDHGQNHIARHGNDGQIDAARYGCKRRIRLQAGNLCRLWIHRVNGAMKAVAGQGLDQSVTDTARIARGTDDRYCSRVKEGMQ